jgi:hypothetical protein
MLGNFSYLCEKRYGKQRDFITAEGAADKEKENAPE